MNKIDSNIKVFYRYLISYQFEKTLISFMNFFILLLMTYYVDLCINVVIDSAAGRLFSALYLALRLGNVRIVIPRFHTIINDGLLDEPLVTSLSRTTTYSVD